MKEYLYVRVRGNIMPLMNAIQVAAPSADFNLVEKEIPEPKQNEVLIKVEANVKS